MIGLDTNVVIRYLAQDDATQAAQATGIFDDLTEAKKGYLSAVTMVELDWVLCGAYGADRTKVAAVLQGLLEAREIALEKPDAVRRALTRVAHGAGFADALIAALGHDAGCTHTVTFDRAAARSAGMRLID